MIYKLLWAAVLNPGLDAVTALPPVIVQGFRQGTVQYLVDIVYTYRYSIKKN